MSQSLDPAVSVRPSVLAARQRSELLFDNGTVVKAVDRLAVRLSVAFADANPLLICVMNGGLPFTAALMQRLQFPLQLTYVHVGRYGQATRGGELVWKAAPDLDLAQRHVLLLDDIVDEGITLEQLVHWALDQEAASVATAVLVDKRVGGERPFKVDYAALTCPDRYVFGWGMDIEGYWRNLPDIYALPADHDGREGL